MALVAKTKQTVMLLGWSDPYQYQAGELEGRNGERVQFPAGSSMRVFVGTDKDGHDCELLKVKTAECQAVADTLAKLGRWAWVEIEYTPGGQPRLFSVRPLDAKAA